MTSRVRKSRGCVELRGKRWFLRIAPLGSTAGTGGAAGRRIRVELGEAGDIRSATAARRAADAWLSRNMPAALQQGTAIGFADYCRRFLSIHATLYRGSSQRRYRSIIVNHLVPELGALPLWAIGPAEVRAMLARRREAGLTRATLGGIRAVLLQLLRQARADDFDAQGIDSRLVRLPRQDLAEKEQRHVGVEELDAILAAAGYPWRALYAVMGLAGLRISEALGLAWKHVDLSADAPLLHVRQGAAGGVLLPLKTRTSRADLPISAPLAAILLEYRAVWRENPAGLLFASRNGNPMQSENIRQRQWLPLLERLGLPHAGFHALRHGLPRRLFAAGCSASVVRQLMRHGSLQITERYVHTTAEDLRAAVNAATMRHNEAQRRPVGAQSVNGRQETTA